MSLIVINFKIYLKNCPTLSFKFFCYLYFFKFLGLFNSNVPSSIVKKLEKVKLFARVQRLE